VAGYLPRARGLGEKIRDASAQKLTRMIQHGGLACLVNVSPPLLLLLPPFTLHRLNSAGYLRASPVLHLHWISRGLRVGEWNERERERKRRRLNLVTLRALAVPYWPMRKEPTGSIFH